MRASTAALAPLMLIVSIAPALAEEVDEEDKNRDHEERLRTSLEEASEKRFLHGFRLGYLYLANPDRPLDPSVEGSPSLAERYGIRSPHQFVIGYEVTWRMTGHDWLNVLLVGNASISGLEQSRFFPSASSIIGFELFESFQLGVGVNVMPVKEKVAHMLVAAGWTPRVGDFYTPLHLFFIPDVDGMHRMGVTVGVNW